MGKYSLLCFLRCPPTDSKGFSHAVFFFSDEGLHLPSLRKSVREAVSVSRRHIELTVSLFWFGAKEV